MTTHLMQLNPIDFTSKIERPKYLDRDRLSKISPRIYIRESPSPDGVLTVLLDPSQSKRRRKRAGMPSNLPCKTETEFLIFRVSLESRRDAFDER